ncbi:hypothetical protein BDM02DRAFT_3112029 [Thelephora ganbajun]|uniref:Uncharacterized protein n=1 Tax=Thelephora ganbajun TaxID=370292 RepID=A0ACB6ZLR5_THEGA|nr:hypothetical protein BDM02DRAFT_3112029 [Thelephora ganbajun]
MPTSTTAYPVAFDLTNDTDSPCSLQSSTGRGFAKFLLAGDVTSLGLMAGADYHYRLSWQEKEYSVRVRSWRDLKLTLSTLISLAGPRKNGEQSQFQLEASLRDKGIIVAIEESPCQIPW